MFWLTAGSSGIDHSVGSIVYSVIELKDVSQ